MNRIALFAALVLAACQTPPAQKADAYARDYCEEWTMVEMDEAEMQECLAFHRQFYLGQARP